MEKARPDFSNLFYYNPQPSWVYVVDTFEILEVNKAALNLFGKTREKLLSLSLSDLYSKEEVTRLVKGQTTIKTEEGNVCLGEFTQHEKSGEKIRVKVNGHKVEFQDRNCIVAVGQVVPSAEKQPLEVNQIIDASLDVFCTVDEHDNFVYLSAASKDLWGYTPEELIGKSYKDLILEEDIAKTNNIVASILDHREVKSFVNRYRKKNGGIAYNLWSARWDEKTRLRYAVAKDCKEKIDQEEKLLQSEQRFRALVQEGSDLVAIADENGNYLYVSPSSTAILGITPEEFIGKSALDFVHPDDLERTLAGLKEVYNVNLVKIDPYRFKNHKNEWRWLETVLTNLLDNPAVRGIVANSRDITDKIEENRKLKLFESVVTNTNDAVLITEADPFDEPGPRIIYVNEAFTKMTGYEAEEVIGKSPRLLQGPNSNRKDLAKLSSAIRKWQPYEVTTINYKKSGEEFWINFTVTPVADETGWYTHWIAIERDVTEQKVRELEKELLAQISEKFNTENELASATDALCKTISKYGKFDWVEIWTTNREKSQMQLLSHYVAEPQDEKFYDYSKEVDVYQKSESLVGNVWSQRMELFWNADETANDFGRSDAAIKVGLKSIVGIPLIFNDEVMGVLKVGTKKDANYLKKEIRLFQRLERFIGSELNRKKLENDLSHLIGSIPDILCLTDFKGKFLKMNKSGCDLLGYKEEDVLYHSFEDFVHSADKGIFTNEIMQLATEETTFQFENRYITKSGESLWLSWYCNSDLREGLIYATAKNITEEKKIRELNQQVGKLAKIGSWEVDLVNQTLYWSDQVHRLHDTDPKSFIPNLEEAINFYRDDFRQMVQSNIEKCISTGVPFDFEAVLVTANKKEIWVRSNGSAEFVDGVCTRIYGSVQDIDDRKQSEIRLQSFADNLPGVVFQYLIYPDNTVALKHVTKGAHQVWGYTAEEVLQNNLLVRDGIKAGGEFEGVKKSIFSSIETKTKWTARWKYEMPSGEINTHLGYGAPIFLADGTILFNTIVLDVTQEAKNEELLEQITKLARIGSWELDLVNQEEDNMYWSPMLFEILEADDSYNPTLTGGIEFYIGESKERIQKAVDLLIKEGTEFDEEVLLRTLKGRECWNRVIGKSEIVNNKRTRIYGSYQDIDDRKIAALELEKSLKTLKDFRFSLDQSSIIAFLDTKGGIISVNDNFCEISKYTREELLEESHPLINGNHHPKEFFKNLRDTIQSGKVWRGEIKNSAKDGSYYWVYTTIVPFLDEQNNPVQYLAIHFDITSSKLAEQEKNSLQATLEFSLNEIYIFDAETLLFSYVNKGALLNLGYSESEIKELTPLDIKPDYTTASFNQLVIPLINNEKEKIIFFTNHKRKDGSLYPAEIHLQLVNEGNNKRFLAVILDITERKEAKESILQANERFTKVTEATNDAIWDWNIVDQRFYRSKAIERFFGKRTSKLFTEDDFWRDKFHPEDLVNIQTSIQEALADPHCARWELEYRVFNEDGKTVYVRDRGIIIRDADNKAVRMVGAMTDITEQKHMTLQLSELNKSLQQHSSELERSNKELEQFAFIASHDLQEPLRMISSFMDLLQRKYGDQFDEKGHQYIHFAMDGAKRMKQIILDLLEYSRAGKPAHGKEEVDLNEVITDFKLLRRKLILEKSASIKSNHLPRLYTYKAVITQILHCLLDNALKYSSEGVPPLVEIKAEESKVEWKFSLKDNGIGIDSHFYDKIFIIFQRLHNNDQYAGTGIGLSIAKRNVDILGGRIWLESEVGSGSVFYFTIPKNN